MGYKVKGKHKAVCKYETWFQIFMHMKILKVRYAYQISLGDKKSNVKKNFYSCPYK